MAKLAEDFGKTGEMRATHSRDPFPPTKAAPFRVTVSPDTAIELELVPADEDQTGAHGQWPTSKSEEFLPLDD